MYLDVKIQSRGTRCLRPSRSAPCSLCCSRTSADTKVSAMGVINDIAERYVARATDLDPVMATSAGIAGHDDRLTDLSLAGFAARAELDRVTVAELTSAEPESERERTARAAMLERLGLAVELYDAGETTRDVNVIASWIQEVRQGFDLNPTDGEEAQRNIPARMAAVPAVYADLRQTYAEAARENRIAARRQVIECAKQCAQWSAPGSSFYRGLVDRTGATGALLADLTAAADAASAATAELGKFLETELLPLAPEPDAVGRDRYALAS